MNHNNHHHYYYHYYIVRNNNMPPYTIRSKKPVTKDDIQQDKATVKYVVPISAMEWVWLTLKFGTSTTASKRRRKEN